MKNKYHEPISAEGLAKNVKNKYENAGHDKAKKNPRQKAIAIKYDPDEIAPTILAKGAGVIAEKILENAQNSDIEIHKDAALADDLTRLDLGEFIPPELYQAVAQILVFISDLDKEGKENRLPR
ncbi:MAG: EscU/YscU/HrcU family type III secretion system export apparatus switch protein [Defluviitaleaceae bacterium]|nr:EscU/YscU/HrcU family type III secretion system export apparatus switch protein [Defluviitaleaceae bacterium]